MRKIFNISLFLVCVVNSVIAVAQENSPFSRYGLGDLVPNQMAASRAMGGMTSAFADAQAINTLNPASYTSLRLVTYDLGFIVDQRRLNSNNPEGSFNSINFTPSYVTIGVPISAKRKMFGVLGVRPVTRVNYSIVGASRIPGIDSIQNLFQGSGGLNQLFIGVAKRWKGLSIGINTGYLFGRKQTSTKTIFVNDTVQYQASLHQTNVNFSRLFIQGGLQYEVALKSKTDANAGQTKVTFLRLGLTGNLQQKMNAERDDIAQTVGFNQAGGTVRIDSVFSTTGTRGSITLPSSINIGVMYGKNETGKMGAYDRWMIGAEYSATNWNAYRFFGQPDRVTNAWTARLGAQITPNPTNVKNLLARSTYRVGMYRGKDYINADGNGLQVTGFTLGMGFNLRKFNAYSTQFTMINLAADFGQRGSSVNNVSERFVRITVGLSLSDIWFQKRRYD